MRHALNYVAYKDRRAVAAELKRIYQAVTVAEAERALEQFSERWDGKYPSISALWLRHWEHIINLNSVKVASEGSTTPRVEKRVGG